MNESVCRILRGRAGERDLRNKELAELTGMKADLVGRLLHNRQRMKLDECELLCKATDMDMWRVIRAAS